MDWLARIASMLIMGQTLFYKFSGAAESVTIFTQLGVEPWGRLTTAFAEWAACFLLLLNRSVHWGSLLGLGLMTGAVVSHVFVIGVIRNDGGQLFYYALAVMVCCLYLCWRYRRKFLSFLQ